MMMTLLSVERKARGSALAPRHAQRAFARRIKVRKPHYLALTEWGSAATGASGVEGQSPWPFPL
jgi:hypothetical protein